MSENNPPNMGTWNNRIFRHKADHGDWYAIHETHYDDDGKPIGWTVDAQEPFGETVDDLISSLKLMLADAERFKNAVLDYDSEPEGKLDAETEGILALGDALDKGEITKAEYDEEMAKLGVNSADYRDDNLHKDDEQSRR